MDVHIFWAYWWLIFPVGFLVTRVIRLFLYNSYERKKLNIMKAYLDRGKDVPPALYRDL